MIKATFQDISLRVKTILEAADTEVNIATAWFTNYFLFRILKNLTKEKKIVRLVISDSPHNFAKLDFAKLVRHGAEVFVCPTQERKFMHHKFCIVGNEKGFTGSYNWSMSAEKNFENIVEFDEATAIKQFQVIFSNIVKVSVPFGAPLARPEETPSAESLEDGAFFRMQERFEDRVDQTIKEIVSHRVPINTDSLYRLLDQYGAVGAARILASSESGTNLQPGFRKLAERNLLELSFESLILQPEFRPLFTPKVIAYAENKLELGRIEAQLSPTKTP